MFLGFLSSRGWGAAEEPASGRPTPRPRQHLGLLSRNITRGRGSWAAAWRIDGSVCLGRHESFSQTVRRLSR